MYSDEVTPGNPLSTNNKRKFQAVYFSFMEFGVAALSHEEAWFCMMIEFSTAINDLAAGMSQMFAALINVFFDPSGLDISRSGVALPGDGGTRLRLFAKMAAFLQDGGAHKSTWHCRGDGASKF